MSLHLAEVIADNYTNSYAASGGTGFWSGTKSDGTFSGDNCRDWSSDRSSDNGTWGSFLAKVQQSNRSRETSKICSRCPSSHDG